MTVRGDEPLSACEAGFHFASIAEVHDWSNFLYDTGRGGDQGMRATIEITLISDSPLRWRLRPASCTIPLGVWCAED